MKDFKKIADDIMSDIEVNEVLKEKTLKKCLKKNHIPINKLLIVAAIFLMIIGIANISNIITLNNEENQEEASENNIMMSIDDNESTTDNSGNNILSFEEEKSWDIDTFDNAKRDFENIFIIPRYIPEDYELEKINGYGFEEGKAYKITLRYFLRDKSFIVVQEQKQIENHFNNFKEVDINGVTGYLNTNISTNEGSEENINTELHWFKDEVHYIIQGLITKEDAIKVAKSMK